jgi:hypothetical protein
VYDDFIAGKITYDEYNKYVHDQMESKFENARQGAAAVRPKEYGLEYVSTLAEELAAKRLEELIREQEAEREKLMGKYIQEFDKDGYYTKEWMEKYGGTAYPENQKSMEDYNEYMVGRNARMLKFDAEQKRTKAIYDEERRKETEKRESQERAGLEILREVAREQKKEQAREQARQAQEQARLFEENKREQARLQEQHHQQQGKIRHGTNLLIQRSRNRSNERFQRIKENYDNDTIFNRAYNGK